MISIDKPYRYDYIPNAICTPNGWLVTLIGDTQYDTYIVNDKCTHFTRGTIHVDDEQHIRFPEFNHPMLLLTNQGTLDYRADDLFTVKQAKFGCLAITKEDLNARGNFSTRLSILYSLVCFGYNITKPCLIVANENQKVEILYPDKDIEMAFPGYDNTILVITKNRFIILDNPLI